MSREQSARDARRERALSAYSEIWPLPARGEIMPQAATADRAIASAIEAAIRVRITDEVIDAAENASGYGGDISRDTYRGTVIAAFRAAGFEVEE